MKNLKDIILEHFKYSKFSIYERLHINKDIKSNIYNYHPKTRDELIKIVDKLIKERGNKADLNDIDTSEITDMDGIFEGSNFNGDISKWDVSNVKDMEWMFGNSEFTGKNGDISNWDVSNVKIMTCMFYKSKFDGDISKWNVSKVESMNGMFYKSPIEKNPPKWYKN